MPIKGDGVIQLRLPKSKSFPEGEVRKFSVKKLVIAHFAKIDKDKGSLKLRGEIAGQDELVEIKPLQLEAMVKQCIGPFPHNTGIGRDGDKKIRISKDPKAEPIVILRTK